SGAAGGASGLGSVSSGALGGSGNASASARVSPPYRSRLRARIARSGHGYERDHSAATRDGKRGERQPVSIAPDLVRSTRLLLEQLSEQAAEGLGRRGLARATARPRGPGRGLRLAAADVVEAHLAHRVEVSRVELGGALEV